MKHISEHLTDWADKRFPPDKVELMKTAIENAKKNQKKKEAMKRRWNTNPKNFQLYEDKV